MEIINGLSNRQCFVNLITEKGNQQHLSNFLRDLKNVQDYDDGFKLSDAYKSSYKERLKCFIEEYNGHTSVLKFISKELEQLKFIRLYPFSIKWELEDAKDEIYDKILSLWPFVVSAEDSEFMQDDYFDILGDLFFFLHTQQSQIFKFLNEIKEHILESNPKIEEPIDVSSFTEEEIDDPLKDTMAAKLRLLYHLGVLDYLKEKYKGERNQWGKILNKAIGHNNPKSVERSVIDFYKDQENKKSKNDFRIGYEQDLIEKYISSLLREK